MMLRVGDVLMAKADYSHSRKPCDSCGKALYRGKWLPVFFDPTACFLVINIKIAKK